MLGGLDVLVNNAGMIFQGGIEATPPDAWRELLAVNLTAAFLYSKACFGPIRDGGGGSIVHIVSDTGIRGIHSIAAYSVTKAGMRMLSDMLALEGARVNVRSNADLPRRRVARACRRRPPGSPTTPRTRRTGPCPRRAGSARRATWPRWSRGSPRRTPGT